MWFAPVSDAELRAEYLRLNPPFDDETYEDALARLDDMPRLYLIKLILTEKPGGEPHFKNYMPADKNERKKMEAIAANYLIARGVEGNVWWKVEDMTDEEIAEVINEGY